MYLKALVLTATLATCWAYSALVEQDNRLQCIFEGRFANPYDCGQYYDCVPSDNGQLLVHEQSCFGHAFHPALKACVPVQMVKGCIPYSTRSFHEPDSRTNQLCNNVNHEFICSDCKTIVLCVDGKSYTDTCGYGNVCSRKGNFSGGVCYPGDPTECTCNEANIFRRDFYNPSKFLSCGAKGSDPFIHSCQQGLFFNEESLTCETEFKSTCSASGTFAITGDCTKYYTCIATTRGYAQKEFTCRNKTMFNERTGKCEDPCEWYSGNFSCPTEGRFANPTECTKYYKCIPQLLNPDRLIWLELDCPDGYEWSQKVNNNQGQCVATATAEEICVPLEPKPSTCKIPNEWCITAECNPACDNGQCVISDTGSNVCSCSPGWEGSQCQTPECKPACDNGQCVISDTGSNVCSCSPGWEGSQCQTRVCNPKCINGQCVISDTGSNTCSCSSGWVGSQCQIDLKNWHPAILDGSPGATSQWDNGEHSIGQAFIDNPKIGWCSGWGLPHSIWKKFHQPIKVLKLTFQRRQNFHRDDLPTKFDVFGSNNEDCKHQDSWMILVTDNSGIKITKEETKIIDIPASKARRFRCYGIRVRESSDVDLACIANIKFYIDSGVSREAIRTQIGEKDKNNMFNIADCVSPWVHIGNSTGCFLIVQKSMNWNSARKYCQNMGGDLPVLNVNYNQFDMKNYYEISGMKNINYWVGANDHSGSWRWVNGNPVTFGWKYNQYNEDHGEDMCMFTYMSGQHEPLTNYCSHTLSNVICEK